MTLREQIDADLKTAMKTRDQNRLDTIRFLKSALQYKEVEGGAPRTLNDADIVQVVSGLIKQRRDAGEQFRTGGRDDLAEKGEREIAVLQAYLPRQLSADELEALVTEAVRTTGASSPKDMGAVMKVLQPQVAGRADGRVIADTVKRRLSAG